MWLVRKGWSDKQIEELRRLWEEELLSLNVIGRHMGRSKGSIAGKVHRLHLKQHGTFVLGDARSIVITLQDWRTQKGCTWPIGNPRDKDFRFCGEEQLLGKSYCFAHMIIAHPQLKKKEKARALSKSAAVR